MTGCRASDYVASLRSAKFRYKALKFESRADDIMLLELNVVVERFPNPIKTSF
jgi:hypothetical protein